VHTRASGVAAGECRTPCAEAKQKHAAFLEIKGESHRLKPLALKHIRPFIFDEIHLEKVRACVRARVRVLCAAVLRCLVRSQHPLWPTGSSCMRGHAPD
jgi:hypothetical protein